MKVLKIITVSLLFFVISCQEISDYKLIKKQLIEMAKVDQDVQMALIDLKTEKEKINQYKKQDSVFKNHTNIIKILFDKYGFLGYDKIDKEGSEAFWILVQHADHDTIFQNQVLKKMKIEVLKNNASAKNYAYLQDRILINSGENQIYGTQLEYKGLWVVPKKLQDSSNVNKRRKEIGLKSIEKYLNNAMEFHYKMNKTRYNEMGVFKPNSYTEK